MLRLQRLLVLDERRMRTKLIKYLNHSRFIFATSAIYRRDIFTGKNEHAKFKAKISLKKRYFKHIN